MVRAPASLQEAFSHLEKACITPMMEEMSLGSDPLGLLDFVCMESICALVAALSCEPFIYPLCGYCTACLSSILLLQ